MRILHKPIITEKANLDSELNNRFAFVVDHRANKIEIKKAVESAYGVTVDKVRTINVRPDRQVRYTKDGVMYGRTTAYKKAIVQVADGDTIDLYSNI
ncbi:MAG TPA: 50S ribosomal protein L23 [Flavobacteriaceae bacterium]|nr:50S ribosomal protein L23 [Flavobacteriaceae bacterium]